MANIFDYSTTAGNNTAAGGVSIAEGMATGDVNDGIRAIMADLAAYVDLTGGAKVTAGSSNAYTVASTGLSLSAYANGLLIVVRVNFSNTGACTLNLDSLGAKDIKVMGVGGIADPAAGQIKDNGIYALAYSATNNAFMLLTPSLGTIAALDADDLGSIAVDDITVLNTLTLGDGTFTGANNQQLLIWGDDRAGLRIENNDTAGIGRLSFFHDSTLSGGLRYDHSDDKMYGIAAGTDVTTTTVSGFMVGTDALIDPSVAGSGCSLAADGLATFSRGGDVPLRVKRSTDDGTLVQFYQGTSVEGVISVSATTVTYGSFCGVHWSQGLTDLLPGTILESIDEMCVWPNEVNITLPKVALASEGSRSVYGVYHATDEGGDLLVAGLGALYIRIHPDWPVERGDLIESAGGGLGRPMASDVIRSSTVGKVTSATRVREYPDGSYLVPCTLYCG